MIALRVLLLGSLLGGLALVACGGGGAGGPYTSAAPGATAPALGTNSPTSPKPSSDPYSGYGY
jgi:hypothetical protein